MAKSRGKIQKAVIRRLAADLRIPLAAAAHKYDCMSIRRKQDLCKREEARAAALRARKEQQP